MFDPWAKISGPEDRVRHVCRSSVNVYSQEGIQTDDSSEGASKRTLDWIPASTQLTDHSLHLVLEPHDEAGLEGCSGETMAPDERPRQSLKGHHTKEKEHIVINLDKLYDLRVRKEGSESDENTFIKLEDENWSLCIWLSGTSGSIRASSLVKSIMDRWRHLHQQGVLTSSGCLLMSEESPPRKKSVNHDFSLQWCSLRGSTLYYHPVHTESDSSWSKLNCSDIVSVNFSNETKYGFCCTLEIYTADRDLSERLLLLGSNNDFTLRCWGNKLTKAMLDPWAKTLIHSRWGCVSHVGRASVRRESRRELQRDSVKEASKSNFDWIPAWTHLDNSTFLLVLEPRDLGCLEGGSGETTSKYWGPSIGLKGHSKQEKPIVVNLKELQHLSVLREGKTSGEDTIVHLEDRNGSFYIRLPGISGPSRASSLLHLAKENGCSFEQPDFHFEEKTREKKSGTDPSTTLLEQRSGNVDKTASELERLLTLTPEPLVPSLTERAHVADKNKELGERQEVACHPEETAACSASSLPLVSPQGLAIEDGDILVAPHCAGDTYSFIALSSGTYRCQATDIIFEMIAAGQVHYTWKELPAELHREQFIPISSAFDISCDNESLHALRIPHYLDVEHWKDLSKIKMFHSKDGNIDLKDPSEVSATHARVEIQSLSLFALILQFWGVPYRVKAVVLVFKVPGALLKLEVHLIPDDIANIDRIRKKLKKDKYEYFQIPTKCHESLTVDESYSLSCDIQVKRIQPENLKMENSCNENNFFHILFKSEFEEFCLTVKEDRNEKSVWQRTIHWQERDGAETPGTEQSPRENNLLDKIISETSTLADGLQCNLTPILNEFQAKKILTTAEIGETIAKFKNQGGYEAASQLIFQIIHKGPSVSTQVWEALWKTRNTYKQLHGLLREVFPDRE